MMKTDKEIFLLRIGSYIVIAILLYPIIVYLLQSMIELPLLINPYLHVIVTFISGPLILLISGLYVFKWEKRVFGIILFFVGLSLIVFFIIELRDIA